MEQDVAGSSPAVGSIRGEKTYGNSVERGTPLKCPSSGTSAELAGDSLDLCLPLSRFAPQLIHGLGSRRVVRIGDSVVELHGRGHMGVTHQF